jgi:hypothetical protein
MPSASGFLLKEVRCACCGRIHDLFTGDLIAASRSYVFICPQTAAEAFVRYDRPIRVVAAMPEGALSAVANVPTIREQCLRTTATPRTG